MRLGVEDLQVRLCRALDFAYSTVKLFSCSGYKDPIRDELSFDSDKPVAETSMLIYAASGCRLIEPIGSRIEAIASELIRCARTEQVALNIALHPSRALRFALPHIILSKLGYTDREFDAFLSASIPSQEKCTIDRPYSAGYEQYWISGLWNKGAKLIRRRLVEHDSLLFRPVDLSGARREDAYAFTHLMMYATDFGFDSDQFPGEMHLALFQASSLLAKCIELEDYDLAGELLLTWPFSSSSWDPQATFAFHLLAIVEDIVGMLPCGNLDSSYLSTLEGLERHRYAVANSYHTMYVMGFLAAASLKPGMVPPQKIIGQQPKTTCLRPLMSLVDTDNGHWYSAFLTLTDAEQESLTSFIVDLGIAQSFLAQDYSRLAKILSLASHSGLPASLYTIQARDLLSRLVDCAGLFGAEMLPQSKLSGKVWTTSGIIS